LRRSCSPYHSWEEARRSRRHSGVALPAVSREKREFSPAKSSTRGRVYAVLSLAHGDDAAVGCLRSVSLGGRWRGIVVSGIHTIISLTLHIRFFNFRLLFLPLVVGGLLIYRCVGRNRSLFRSSVARRSPVLAAQGAEGARSAWRAQHSMPRDSSAALRAMNARL